MTDSTARCDQRAVTDCWLQKLPLDGSRSAKYINIYIYISLSLSLYILPSTRIWRLFIRWVYKFLKLSKDGVTVFVVFVVVVIVLPFI